MGLGFLPGLVPVLYLYVQVPVHCLCGRLDKEEGGPMYLKSEYGLRISPYPPGQRLQIYHVRLLSEVRGIRGLLSEICFMVVNGSFTHHSSPFIHFDSCGAPSTCATPIVEGWGL
jgi:hypothetical protein